MVPSVSNAFLTTRVSRARPDTIPDRDWSPVAAAPAATRCGDLSNPPGEREAFDVAFKCIERALAFGTAAGSNWPTVRTAARASHTAALHRLLRWDSGTSRIRSGRADVETRLPEVI